MPGKTNRLHVLMILDATSYPSPTGGGAETQVRALSNALRARGHRVTVVVPLTRQSPHASISRVDGVPVCRLRYPHVRMLGGPLLWLKLMGFLYARRKRYDAWHVHVAHHLGAVSALMGHWLGARVVLKVSGMWELEHGALARKPTPVSWLTCRCLMLADHWQAISHYIAQRLHSLGVPASRVVEIPNAVDTARFRQVAASPDPHAKFVFIGRLAEEKGLDTLLHAFADAAGDHPAAQLTLVGTGERLHDLEEIVRRRGIEGQVTFAGYRKDIANVLADANIGVLASRFEGLSNTLLETMSSGLPMVASRISGNEDFVIHGENGWLFAPDDRAGLADCLRAAASLSAEQRHAMGELARATVERKAGFDRVLGRLVTVYRGDRIPLEEASLSEGCL